MAASPQATVDNSRSCAVHIVYTNYRNETTRRTIVPERIWFGTTAWHPEAQWLLDALDVEKGERRSFALAAVRSWEQIEEKEGP